MTRQFYFDNLRLRMGAGGRFLVRLATYVSYGALAASTLVLFFADLPWMRSLGIFFILFLADRLLHIHQAEKRISEMPDNGLINLSYYLSPAALNLLERITEKAIFIGGDVYLWTLKQCLTQLNVRRMLMKEDKRWKELAAEFNCALKTSLHRKLSKNQVLLIVDELVAAAAQNAIANESNYIKPRDLYVAAEKLRARITE